MKEQLNQREGEEEKIHPPRQDQQWHILSETDKPIYTLLISPHQTVQNL